MRDELDILWEEEKIRRRKSYESVMTDVWLTSHRSFDVNLDVRVKGINESKVKEWARKFREMTKDPLGADVLGADVLGADVRYSC